MGITDTVFGTPGQTQVHQTAGSKPPGFNFARDFFNSLGGIAQNPYPTYQGQIDPGLSPTLQSLMRQVQGYSQSAPPEIMAGVQGSLGRFMNPSFMNPVARMQQGGAPDYFNQNPNQTVWNGGNVGGLAGVFGGNQLGSKTSVGGGYQPGPGETVGNSGGYQAGQYQPPGGGQPGMGMTGGYQLPNGQPNQTPPYFNPSGLDILGGGDGSSSGGTGSPGMVDSGDGFGGSMKMGGGGGMMPQMGEQPGMGMMGGFGGGSGASMPWGGGGGGPQQGPIGWTGPGGAGVIQPGSLPGADPSRSFGGYSIQQLQQNPNLASHLGPHAAGLWRAFNPNAGGGPGRPGGPNMMHPTNPNAPGARPGGPLPTKPNRDPRRGGVASLPGMGLK